MCRPASSDKIRPRQPVGITARCWPGRGAQCRGCRAHTHSPELTISRHPAEEWNLFSQQYECLPAPASAINSETCMTACYSQIPSGDCEEEAGFETEERRDGEFRTGVLC
ncbi:hypothetical protein KCP78_25780 [Salmonella enterica subsp. enterica]|nr:hypothetical protein KCP78_25780 [Salmonella enterica subsp. enterica]